MVCCKKCGKEYPDKYMHSHHIIPKEFGGTDEDGRIFLCVKGKNCHNQIHKNLTALKLVTKEEIKEYTLKTWLVTGGVWKLKSEMPICPMCSDTDQRLFIFTIHREYVILRCSKCNYGEKSKEYLKYFLNKEKLNSRVENSQQFLNLNKKIEGLDDDSI